MDRVWVCGLCRPVLVGVSTVVSGCGVRADWSGDEWDLAEQVEGSGEGR